jgi:glycosyltransferase involved in cell wall biosynthesis
MKEPSILASMNAQPQPQGCNSISFIIPAWNEEAFVGATLAALRVATTSLSVPSEIIVVDDGSTDRTAEIAEAQGARVVKVNHRRIAAARNAGAQVAHGDIFVFIDADTLVTDVLLGAALDAVHRGAIGGGCPIRADGSVPIWACLGPFLGNAFIRIFRVAPGCFLFCTRAAFQAVGGFDTTLFITEEITMSNGLKRHGRFVLLPHYVVTSARKLQSISFGNSLLITLYAILGGSRFFRSHKSKEMYYGQR